MMERWIVIEHNGWDEEHEFFDDFVKAVDRAQYLSGVNSKHVTVSDITEEDLRRPDDPDDFDLSDDSVWDNYKSCGNRFSVSYDKGRLVVGQYDYQELFELYERTRSQESVDALGQWLDDYGGDSWNGECYDCSFTDRSGVKHGEGMFIRRVYGEENDAGQMDIIGYEVC